jgi:Adenylate and Guanylate cyclase catalytic domain
VVVVVQSSCGDHFTYKIMGKEAVYLGQGDHHDPQYEYNDLAHKSPFAPFLHQNTTEQDTHCNYEMEIYPSAELESAFRTNDPILYAVIVVTIFVCTALVFLLFDYTVTIRQRHVEANAKRAHRIVSSLFPSNVRDRIMKEAAEEEEQGEPRSKRVPFISTKNQLMDFLGEKKNGNKEQFDTKPIADLFPSATIMVSHWCGSVVDADYLPTDNCIRSQFADIVGFTAWSSAREPCQVFTLLETVYQAFDEIAKRRRVFKVRNCRDMVCMMCAFCDLTLCAICGSGRNHWRLLRRCRRLTGSQT